MVSIICRSYSSLRFWEVLFQGMKGISLVMNGERIDYGLINQDTTLLIEDRYFFSDNEKGEKFEISKFMSSRTRINLRRVIILSPRYSHRKVENFKSLDSVLIEKTTLDRLLIKNIRETIVIQK